MQLLPCARCRRHIAVDEPVCPFCAAPAMSPMARPSSSLGAVGRLSRAAVFAGATLAGCHPKEPPAQTVVTATPPAPDAAPAIDAVTAVATPAPADAAQTPDAAPVAATAQIHGVVRDGVSQQPFFGVSVAVYAQNKGVVRRTTTMGGGVYRIDKLEPGDYTVIFQPPSDGNWRDPPRPPTQKVIKLAANADLRVDASIGAAPPRPVDTGPCCKPYGAPPARRRVV